MVVLKSRSDGEIVAGRLVPLRYNPRLESIEPADKWISLSRHTRGARVRSVMFQRSSFGYNRP
jgi:hypothetical protein